MIMIDSNSIYFKQLCLSVLCGRVYTLTLTKRLPNSFLC